MAEYPTSREFTVDVHIDDLGPTGRLPEATETALFSIAQEALSNEFGYGDRAAHWEVFSLAEGIDATTPAGKLQMHILGAIAEFEREARTPAALPSLPASQRVGTRELVRDRCPVRQGSVAPTTIFTVSSLPTRLPLTNLSF